MGCRKMSLIAKQPGLGRDKTEQLFLEVGFRVKYAPNFTKTTHSVRFTRYKNLIEGLTVKAINRVVQTDITYFWIREKFCYLVFIIDIYSRRIIGYHASEGMEAEANMAALNMMIKLRGKVNINRLIHHSDRGSQYHCRKYLKMLADHKIEVSMCVEAWENAYTERINQTIKNEYLNNWNITDLKGLKKQLKRAVKLYNMERPHWNLPKHMPPIVFEKHMLTNPKANNYKVIIYKPE